LARATVLYWPRWVGTEPELGSRRMELELEPRRLELLQARVDCTEGEEEEEELVGRMPEPVQEVVGMKAEEQEVVEQVGNQKEEEEEGGNLRGCSAPARHTSQCWCWGWDWGWPQSPQWPRSLEPRSWRSEGPL